MTLAKFLPELARKLAPPAPASAVVTKSELELAADGVAQSERELDIRQAAFVAAENALQEGIANFQIALKRWAKAKAGQQ
jgi:hypothetical protein